MGTTYAEIEISNPREPAIGSVRALALADTGAMMLCLPRRVSDALRLETAEERRVELADGSDVTVPYVGPIRVRFGERACFVGAFVMGDEVILGAVPMEDMDLVVSPLTRTVSIREKPSRHLV
jgi:clan AA aspartic protease